MRLIDILYDAFQKSSIQQAPELGSAEIERSIVALRNWIDDFHPSGHELSDYPERSLCELAYIEGRLGKTPLSQLHFYITVAFASLSTAFILTQRTAALRRIESSKNQNASEILNRHLCAEQWITVGISHLTTSRQHQAVPAVSARLSAVESTSPDSNPSWILNGTIPWVTAAKHSKAIVVGASDEQNPALQYLFYVPTHQAGIDPGSGMHLLALSDSCTDEVQLRDLRVTTEQLLHGPIENVLSVSQSNGAGGLQTSALALGLAACAIDWILGQTQQRGNLSPFYESLAKQWTSLFEAMNHLASGTDCRMDAMTLRKDSNTLVLRATQSALAISKGAGFLAHNSIARWTREAMFFLVWSCPQGVAEAHLCEFTQFAPIP